MYTRESLEALRNLVDVKDVLVQIGGISLRDITESGDEIRCPCPLHYGDNKTGFSWKKSRGYWTCFTRGCGDNHSHDIFGFVSAKLGVPFNQAAEKLASLVGFNLEKGVGGPSTDSLNTNQAIKEHLARGRFTVQKLRELSQLPGYNEEGFDNMLKYLELRRYTYDQVKVFNFYPQLDSYGFERMGMPVYDEDNRLVGVQARLMDKILQYPETVTLEDGSIRPVGKYKMNYKFEKGSILYNLNNAKRESVKKGLIIVEGQLDVSRLYTYGYKNAVCTMGTSLTDQQTALMYKHCYHTTFLVEEGEAATKGVIKSIKQLKTGMRISIAKLPSGDADSNPKEVVIQTLENARELSLSEIAAICKGERSI